MFLSATIFSAGILLVSGCGTEKPYSDHDTTPPVIETSPAGLQSDKTRLEDGTWLRATFFSGECSYSACTSPVEFEGFDFRSSGEVTFKQIFLDAYYERGTFASKKEALEAKGLVVSLDFAVK